MKKVIFLLLFAQLLFSDNMSFANDKKKHLGISFLLGNATGMYMKYNYQDNSYTKNLLIGTSLAMIPGVLKEYSDSKQVDNYASSADLAYDLLGSITGTIFGIYISKKLFVNIKQRKVTYNVKF